MRDEAKLIDPIRGGPLIYFAVAAKLADTRLPNN